MSNRRLIYMKKILFLLFLISISGCAVEDEIVGPDYSDTAILAGKVTESGFPAVDFSVRVIHNSDYDLYWSDGFKNSTGSYTIYINREGIFEVTAYLKNGNEKVKKNITLKLGEITEVNFEF